MWFWLPNQSLNGMTLHPGPEYRPIPVKAVIPGSLGTRSQRINPWIPVVRENPKQPRHPVEAPCSSKTRSLVPALHGLRYSPISQREPFIQGVEEHVAGGFCIRMQPIATTPPAGNRDLSHATPGSPQVCRPPASAQPTLDQDPESRSTLLARGPGCTRRRIQ